MGSLLALYGSSSMQCSSILRWFSDIHFFLLGVLAPLLHNSWRVWEYLGTYGQNGSKPEIWPWGILIHALELKLRPFEVFPYVLYREAMHLQYFHVWCVLFRNMLKNGEWATCLHCMALLGVLCVGFRTFFFCLVCRLPCYIIIHGGVGSTWGHNLYTGRMDQN